MNLSVRIWFLAENTPIFKKEDQQVDERIEFIDEADEKFINEGDEEFIERNEK